MNIFKQFIKSIYSPQTIAKFRFQKIGKSILYVFILMLITSIPASTFLGINISNFANQIEETIKEDLPYFEIKDGTLNADIDEPYAQEIGGNKIIFDPTGAHTINDFESHEQAFVMLENDLAVITEGTPTTFSYQELNLATIDKDSAVDMIDSVMSILPLILAIFIITLYLFSTGLKFVGIFFLSFIGLMIKKSKAPDLSFRQVWILSAYSVTLPTVIFSITDVLFGAMIGIFEFIIYWLIAIMMIYTVINKVTQQKSNATKPQQ
ncbi:DUF1189 domain-containing protein [Texcoconibacillus texcoconensis]|uniref:DUF1189 domain-containing protein n=1 Tax=Texcoconibacillus texcoconensis TaxID=1095777 RepID=A0A840QRB8_9BACI|nr:DUF1189 domain-containing protein [Texcoconibacillus texcoconensis]MBB5173899.1 hypothetical protein [Texcoconibacillus texcoconensis]